jgi:hypothetical protein
LKEPRKFKNRFLPYVYIGLKSWVFVGR